MAGNSVQFSKSNVLFPLEVYPCTYLKLQVWQVEVSETGFTNNKFSGQILNFNLFRFFTQTPGFLSS